MVDSITEEARSLSLIWTISSDGLPSLILFGLTWISFGLDFQFYFFSLSTMSTS